MCTASELASPADIGDLGAVFGRGDYGLWVLARRQILQGPSWAFRDAGGTALVVAGLVPIERRDDAAEAWFWPAPGAAASMLAIVRAARLTLAASGYRVIRAHVRSEAGQKVALLLGFRPAGRVGEFEAWERTA